MEGGGGGIDDSTPVSQSRHTLRFQPIACRGIIRRPRVLRTRPEMVWQAFVRSHCTWSGGGVGHGRKETRKTASHKNKNGSLAVLTFV